MSRGDTKIVSPTNNKIQIEKKEKKGEIVKERVKEYLEKKRKF